MSVERLADRLSAAVRERRLRRARLPVDGPHMSFEELPEEDRRNWLDVADAVLDVYEDLEQRAEAAEQGLAEAANRFRDIQQIAERGTQIEALADQGVRFCDARAGGRDG